MMCSIMMVNNVKSFKPYTMKKALFLLITLVLFTACKKDDISHRSEFNKSYDAWLNFKQTHNNSYSYTVNWGSWTGYGYETVLNIVNGKITGRNFKAYRLVTVPPATVPTNEILKTWTETAATLNTHGNEAAELLTLDGVYDKAKNVWLKADKKTNEVYFEARNNGLISSCGFVSNGCQDDCFNGISITSIGPAL